MRLNRANYLRSMRSQRGMALYTALIMLILLALIGIVGMRIATMEERMSANYLASNRAFQSAESQVRTRENEIAQGTEFEYENCSVPYDPEEWSRDIGDSVLHEVRTRNVSICMQQCGAGTGGDLSESACNMFRSTAFSRDQDTVEKSSSQSAVDTIFIRP